MLWFCFGLLFGRTYISIPADRYIFSEEVSEIDFSTKRGSFQPGVVSYPVWVQFRLAS